MLLEWLRDSVVYIPTHIHSLNLKVNMEYLPFAELCASLEDLKEKQVLVLSSKKCKEREKEGLVIYRAQAKHLIHMISCQLAPIYL